MFAFILTVHIIICLVLIFIVLLQSGRGAELGAAFGGLGQTNSIRTPETFIAKFTTWLAIIFMVTSLFLAFFSSDISRDSVIDRVIPTTFESTAIQENLIPVTESSTDKPTQ